MAIDYIIDYACAPKEALSTPGILERLKGRARAETIIRLFREHGDERPPSQMGFEFERNTASGETETQVIVVQDLLDRANELLPYEAACSGCPANLRSMPFGCVDAIQYPLTAQSERWMLSRLPDIDEPLLWLLLRQGIQEMGYDGHDVEPLRANGVYFESPTVFERDLQDFIFNSNQIFEMMFLLGHIQPSHAGVLLQFFNAVPRATEADEILRLMNRTLSADEIAERYPFSMTAEENDDRTISEIKQFLKAVHRAWQSGVMVLLDV
ncbi:MAG: hypothetical protein KC547_00640 [Anaerolineae bacterium]|nr:hypothetical protein [Anaerolineae bacterium]